MRYFILLFTLLQNSFANAQTIQSMSFDQLQKKVLSTKDSIVVLNFWATWCKPCVEELPEFEKINSNYKSNKVKVILVNLDFNSKIKSDAEPFVKRKWPRSAS